MFDPAAFVRDAVDEVKRTVEGTAVIAVSGGVDSSVAAKIGSMALGKNLVCVYVDTGFMRCDETEFVKELYGGMAARFRFVDARTEFIEALTDVSDPEKKRKVIGEKFIRVFERVAREANARYLIQGTIAPDWIESGGELRDTIKSHHNVGGLPDDMDLSVVEPLRHIYKDEVRTVAEYLDLSVAARQPFPGPGLAVRVMGPIDEEKVAIVRDACAIVEHEIEAAAAAGTIERPWQYFAVLLPVRSVGVRGDLRAYGYTVAVRAVDSVDAMTASYSKLPHDLLERIATRITNEIKAVNRVVYDISNKPPATIEWE